MPALPAVPKTLRVDTHFTYSEDTNVKVREFWEYVGAAPTNTDLNNLAAEVTSQWTANLKDDLSASVSHDQVIITDLSSSTSAIGSAAGSGAGSGGVSGMAASSAVLESFQIARRYRGGHPRAYWPFGFQAVTQDSQQWDHAYITELGLDLINYRAAIFAFGWPGFGSMGQINVSYFSGFTTHTGTTGRVRNISTVRLVPLKDVVSAHVMRFGIASQRKRLLRLA